MRTIKHFTARATLALCALLFMAGIAQAETLDFIMGRQIPGTLYNNYVLKSNLTVEGTTTLAEALTCSDVQTFGAGFNATGFSLDASGNVESAGYFSFTAGVKITGDGDGAVTILGQGNGSDEDLTLNLDDTANTIVMSSSTGADTIVGLASYSLGAAGVKITGDADGAVTLLGLGDGSDEDITLNLDDVANTVGVSTSTGVTTVDLGAIGVTTTGTVKANLIATPASAQTIGAGGIIAADSCGGLKIVTAAGAVATDTTHSITAPAAANAGCCMDIYNSGAETITIDTNTTVIVGGAANLALTQLDVVRFCSDGTNWVQAAALLSLN